MCVSVCVCKCVCVYVCVCVCVCVIEGEGGILVHIKALHTKILMLEGTECSELEIPGQ